MFFKSLIAYTTFVASVTWSEAQVAGVTESGASALLPSQAPAALDPSYRLSIGDEIDLSVFGESYLSVTSMIDRSGRVRLPLIGDVVVGGLSARDAETLIEKTYIQEEFLKKPQVTLRMKAYAVREIVVNGAVKNSGTYKLPQDSTSIDIRDLIARLGGFTPVARGDAVTITSRREDGTEVIQIVDVAKLMSGRGKEPLAPVLVYPGDFIVVPERLF